MTITIELPEDLIDKLEILTGISCHNIYGSVNVDDVEFVLQTLIENL